MVQEGLLANDTIAYCMGCDGLWRKLHPCNHKQPCLVCSQALLHWPAPSWGKWRRTSPAGPRPHTLLLADHLTLSSQASLAPSRFSRLCGSWAQSHCNHLCSASFELNLGPAFPPRQLNPKGIISSQHRESALRVCKADWLSHLTDHTEETQSKQRNFA